MSRRTEEQTLADFLDSAPNEPAALVIQGDPGVGKTTLWLDVLRRAGERGFRVLAARAAAAESVLAYTALADLLGAVDDSMWADLPSPQRQGLDAALLRNRNDGRVTDARSVAAAFMAVINRLAGQDPVLVAIDDLQWLDASSNNVMSFAARRLPHGVAWLFTTRTEDAALRLQLPSPGTVRRIHVQPMTLGELRQVLASRLGGSLPRSTLLRIHEVSGGNPFYALELAREITTRTRDNQLDLPGSLAELVRTRIGRVSAGAEDALLAMASLADPTVQLVARATNTVPDRLAELLDEAEAHAVVAIDGNRVRFTHPVLAHGVYSGAAPRRRRAMHRRLAELVTEPELRARHLALSDTTGEPQTLEALDTAADIAHSRGAPAAAAELLELAIRLGADTPERRIRSASHHLNAGDARRARALLEKTIDTTEPGMLRAEALSLLGFVLLFGDSFLEAARVLERALGEAGDHLALRTRLLITLSYARYNAGYFSAAARSIEDAVDDAERLGQPHPLSQALSMRVILCFLRGDGLDESVLARALELEDRHADMPMAFRPSMQNAMLLAWTGQLEAAHRALVSIRRRCIERGDENELIFVAVHSVLLEIWRGNFAEAALIAEDTAERAALLGGDVPSFIALTARAALAAYAGRVDEARADTDEAFAASQRCGANLLVVWPITTLGFLEVSLGNYRAALNALQPLLAKLDAAPNATEIVAAAFVPDAVEAMIHLGRLTDAQPLIEALERNGRRLDRAWMLAVGGRCRAMLLAGRGDLNAATAAAQVAMTEHGRLPMPFERARTQLLLGQLQRRQRQRDTATATLRDALHTFERLGTTLWADRVRAELARGTSGRRRAEGLTASEHRVAELAASGMTNKDIAAELFISPKTVEVNLSRVYRKLNIRSRVELYRTLNSSKE